MNSYPNPGDPNQPNQYPPNQGQTGTQYGGGYQSPPIAPSGYGEQPPYQTPPNVQPGYGDQPGYQQGAYQQPQYQAPYQQPPYQQSPYPQRSSVTFDWRYLTAGVGALVAIIAFFLPYSGYNLGIYGGYTYGGSGFQAGHQLLLDFIIALAALAVAALLQFGSQLFKAPTSPTLQKLMNSLTTNQRTWGLILMSIGIFGFFFRFILDLGSLNYWAIGSWLYTIGMIAVIVGGFFVWRPSTSTPRAVPPIR